MKAERNSLFYPGLLGAVRSDFNKLKDDKEKITKFSLNDCLMSGVALFGIKEPSLLKFDEDFPNEESPVKYNFQTLYWIKNGKRSNNYIFPTG